MHSQRIYKYLVLGRHTSYFAQNHSDLGFCQNVLWSWYHQIARASDWCHICYAWWTCFSTVCIRMGTNCALLLADLFLYSYEADFIQGLLTKNENKLARSCNFTFCCIDDVISLNYSNLVILLINLSYWAWNKG